MNLVTTSPESRNDHSLERRTRERGPAHLQSRGRSQGPPPDRFEVDDYEVPHNQYDDGYGERTSFRHGERQGERFPPKERMTHMEGHRPQHLYADYDEYGATRRERLDPRSPKIPSPRHQTIQSTTRSERGQRSERGHDTEYHRRVHVTYKN